MKDQQLNKLGIILLLCFGFAITNAQNLVPNASFEKITKVAMNWTLNDQIFESRMEMWTTPNLGSPDIFSNIVMDKIRPKRAGVKLESHKARTGKNMVGIKTYGCAIYTQHCKEYIQIKLKKSIEKGEQYYIEFWVNPMETSPYTNNIGLAFSDVEIQDNSEYGIYYFDVPVNEKKVVRNKPNDWHRISATVTADGFYDYIIIGNLFTDDETKFETTEGKIKYGYYFIDDVLVRPLKKDPELDLSNVDLEVGNTIALNNIQFETAKADLLSTSFAELDKLVQILEENPALKIQINGHTDNQGSESYNQKLSQNRANSVTTYLQDKGIAADRLTHKGFGLTQPIAPNDTAEGQQLNRRVEFKILNN